MIIVQGWARVAPDAIAALTDAIVAQVTATRAEAGCIDYAMAEDLAEPGLIRISESWVDDAALTAHFGAPHMAAFNAALGAAAPQAIAIYRYDCAGEPVPLVVRGV
jgi:quinol monooxygenase YgiN